MHTQILILGGGIAGCLTACLCHDRGLEVTILEKTEKIMSGASRWNEGKIHLGYTYIGTDSLDTATLMLRGAAQFHELLERITGNPIPETQFSNPIIYLVDRNSIFPPGVLWARASRVRDLLVESALSNPGLSAHLAPKADDHLRRIPREEAAARTGLSDMIDAWITTERAVSPSYIAEKVSGAVLRRDIALVRGTAAKIRPYGRSWHVDDTDGKTIHSKIVINSTWEGRFELESQLQLPTTTQSVRWKAALFGKNQSQFQTLNPSTRIIGRFGDVTPYRNGQVYLAWYPANLLAYSSDGRAPPVPEFDSLAVMESTLQGLGLNKTLLEDLPNSWQVEGGYVVAHGHGDIDQIDSPLHHRRYPGAHERIPGYVSVDTGKFSLGPLVALQATKITCQRLNAPIEEGSTV